MLKEKLTQELTKYLQWMTFKFKFSLLYVKEKFSKNNINKALKQTF